MKPLREEIEEALKTYNAQTDEARADAVMSALERRANEAGSEAIAERAMSLIRDFGKDQIQPWDTITKIIQSSIAEALALHDASPERVAERNATKHVEVLLDLLRWTRERLELVGMSTCEIDTTLNRHKNLASSPVAAKEGESCSPIGWGNEKEYPTEKPE